MKYFSMLLTIAVFAFFASDYTYSGKNVYVWFNSSTVKFVNNWLIEGPVNINFVMYENYPSVEFNSIDEREAYISFPSGAVIPPYLCAKMLNKSKIDINFLGGYNKFNCVLSSILACMFFYGFLTRGLRIGEKNTVIAISLILSAAWAIMPVNLMFLRNHYFSEQASVPLMLMFLVTEIYGDSIKRKSKTLRNLYQIFLFLLIFMGTITDYCFLSLVFVAWLVRIYSEAKKADNKLKAVVDTSWLYVLPVIAGLAFFLWQISGVPNHWEILKNRWEVRTYGHSSFEGDIGKVNLFELADMKFRTCHGTIGSIFFLLAVLFIVIYYFKYVFRKSVHDERIDNLMKFSIIIFVSPLLHALVFFNYTAVHYHTMLKFALPFVFAILTTSFLISEIRRLKTVFGISEILFFVIIFSLQVIYIDFNRSRDWFHFRFKTSNATEIALLVRDNHSFNDVFASFTDSIGANPPTQLVVAGKRVYMIDNETDIQKKFPHLNPAATINYIIDKDDSFKTPEIIAKEQNIVKRAKIRCSSRHFNIYELNE
ncbi:MAG: hypothetical protein LBR13_05335 [Dysgonamonadaceae bacterium]|jgi:hypothetical protein|nr:hypothetical protein [Dysgonamonadaceae bacterium]